MAVNASTSSPPATMPSYLWHKLQLPLFLTLLIGGLAVGLRVWGLAWGLPNQQHHFSYHPDEILLISPILSSFASGDWNPHFFNYGSLYIYLLGLPAITMQLTQADTLAPIYYLGRLITATLGIASVLVLYLALRKESHRLAAISALLLAVLPLHVINSHYATVDVPATCWLVFAFYFALLGAREMKLGYALGAGLAVGLGAATKYNAGLFLLPVLVTPLLERPRKLSVRWLGIVTLGAVVGFVIGCPYFWTPDFVEGVRNVSNYMQTGGTIAFVNAGSGWVYHLLHGLPVGLGYPMLGALIVGIYATFRLPSRAARLSLLWVVFYFLVIGFSKEYFIRYLILLLPFIAVLAAHGLVWLWRAPRVHLVRVAGAVAGLVVIILTTLYTFGQASAFAADDPRDRAWGRIGPMIVSFNPEGNLRLGLIHPPWFYTPPVSPWNAGPMTQVKFAQWNAQRGNHVIVTGWEVAILRSEHPWVFLTSDLETRDLLRLHNLEAVTFMNALGSVYKYRTVIANPAPVGSLLAPDHTWAPPDWLYAWPQIYLYHDYPPVPDEPRF